MKLNEKLVAMAVAATMVVPTIMPVMADGNNTTTVSGTTGTTTATYTVTSSYQWTVPTNITFTDENNGTAQTGTVAVTENVISDNNKLKITISGNGGGDGTAAVNTDQFRVSNGNHYLNYTVAKSSDSISLNAGSSVLEVAAGTNTGSQELTFTLDTSPKGTDTAKVSGTYTGKIIYTASVDSTN